MALSTRLTVFPRVPWLTHSMRWVPLGAPRLSSFLRWVPPRAPRLSSFLRGASPRAPRLSSFLRRASPRAPRLRALFLRWVPPRAPRLKALTLALGFGALLPLSLAPFDWWPLGLVSIAGWLWLLGRSAAGAAALGFAYGVGKYGVGVSWVYVSIHLYGGASPWLAGFLVLLFVCGLALFTLLQGWAYALLRVPPSSGRWAAVLFNAWLFAAVWVLFEWLLTWFLSGFPWLYPGYGHLHTPLAHLVPVGGVSLASLGVVVTAAFLLLALQPERSWGFRATALAIGAAPWLFGLALSAVQWVAPAGERSAALVQGNVDQAVKWRPESREPLVKRYLRLSEPYWGSRVHARGIPPGNSAEGSLPARGAPTHTPAEGSFPARGTPSRSLAEGSFPARGTPSRSLAEGSFPARGTPSRSPAEGSFMRGAGPTRTPAKGSLIVWPEAAITLFEHEAGDLLERLARRGEQSGTALVLGLPRLQVQPESAGRHLSHESSYGFQNAALALGDGEGRYIKRRLVPFGEYVPLEGLLRGLIEFFDLPMSRSAPGPWRQPLLRVGADAAALAICYEVAYADLMRSTAAEADLLITITNDTWFGRSIGPLQHLQIAQARALENGRWLLRTANSGVTAIVDHRGRIQSRLPQFEQGVLAGNFHVMTGRTPYSRFGSAWLVVLCAATLLFAGLRLCFSQTRPARRAEATPR